jgi:UDPglucose--hexose-1-phosphate uridylyltransferase
MNGVGAHEVIIETPDHDLHMGDMPQEHLFEILKIYRNRIADLHKDARLRYVLIFKNYGKVAGASLSHPHTQIIATPITPRTIAAELDSAHEHFLNKERCLFCDIMNQELAMEKRIVMTTPEFVVIEPFASRFPFETWIMPRVHSHDFTRSSDELLNSFAGVLGETLRRLKVALDDPPYNFVLHTAPNTVVRPGKEHYWKTLEYDWHWHLEIIPRLTKVAGFEWGTGFYINPTPPEVAAEYLRSLEE